MKKFLYILCTVISSCFSAKAQVSQYVFSTLSGTYTSISDGTKVINAGVDNEDTGLIGIGFAFVLDRKTYTQFSVSSNGFITLGGVFPGASQVNDLAHSTVPVIAPLWDDLATGTSASSGVSYKLEGLAPKRILSVVWKGMLWDKTTISLLGGTTISFKLKLYETTNAIEFSYLDNLGLVSLNAGASIGISAPQDETLVPSFLSLTSTILTAVSGTQETTGIITKPLAGQEFSFTPAPDLPAVVSAARSFLNQGMPNQQLVEINIPVNAGGSLNLTSITFSNATGTNPPDVTGARLFSTGSNEVFSTLAPVAAPLLNPNGSFTFTPNANNTLAIGNNYFWLVYDVGVSASPGNLVSGQLLSYKVNSSLRIGAFTDIKGTIGGSQSACSENQYNWVHQTQYDESGTVIGESKVYSDLLGRSIQTQQKVLSNTNVLAAQVIYDNWGRSSLQTLPAPLPQQEFCFKDKFITNSAGADYSASDFDGTLTESPGAVNSSSPLGNYYSTNGPEKYVAASSFPYMRSEYFADMSGRPKRISAAGEALRMGSGHEKKVYYMRSTGELSYIYGYYRSYILSKAGSNVGQNLDLEKTVTVNEDGTESIAYSNNAGQLIASCVSGQTDNPCAPQVVTQTMYYYGQRGATIHLPKGSGSNRVISVLIPRAAQLYPVSPNKVRLKITDLSTNEDVTGLYTRQDGTNRIDIQMGASTKGGFYAISYDYTVFNSNITGNNIPSLDISYTLDYTNWSLNFYDNKGSLVKSVTPLGVDCGPVLVDSRTRDCTQRQKIASSATNNTWFSYTYTHPLIQTDELAVKINLRPVFSRNAITEQSAGCGSPFTSAIGVNTNSQSTYLIDEVYEPGPPQIPDVNKDIYGRSNPDVDPVLRFHHLHFFMNVSFYGNDGSNLLGTTTLDGDVDVNTLSLDSRYNDAGITLVNSVLSQYSSILVKVSDIQYYRDGDSYAFNPSVNGSEYNYQQLLKGFDIAVNETFYPNTSSLSSSFSSKYGYNDLKWLTSKQTTDAGIVNYVYDTEGKTRFSQNAEQKLTGKYSYTNYDLAGRALESGEIDRAACQDCPVFQSYEEHTNSPAPYSVHDIVDVGDGLGTVRSQRTRLQYDTPASDQQVPGYTQAFLAGRVSRSANEHSVSWYSYDELGRVTWMIQFVEGLGIKTLNYSYDREGNLIKIAYQKESPAEALYHFYTYDADRRLVSVETSGTDAAPGSVQRTIQCSYSYYQHGEVKRKQIGNGIQGMDYVYTINGWLKSINDPTLMGTRDPGGDGITGIGTGHPLFNKDVFGLTLDYFAGDYVKQGTLVQTYTPASGSPANPDHFNGLVKAMRWQTANLVNANSNGIPMYSYAYDFHNWLTSATFGTATQGTLNNTPLVITVAGTPVRINPPVAPAFTASADYSLSNITYDLNGNFKTLNRNGYAGNGLEMDKLTYNYERSSNGVQVSNKLSSVADAASTDGSYPNAGDVKAGQQNNNYQYNEKGQVVQDNQKHQLTAYDVYGKVVSVTSSTTGFPIVKFTYNEKGYRIRKDAYNPSTGQQVSSTWYLNDAAGNILSVYTSVDAATVQQRELTIFGGQRLGILASTVTNVATTDPLRIDIPQQLLVLTRRVIGINNVQVPGQTINNTTQKYVYEITDHLGNVRATVTSTASNPFVLEATREYYPHGSLMPGRGLETSTEYRYDYQGQLKDAETGKNDFYFRQYDPALARWTDTDPYGQYDSPYLSMGNAHTVATDPDGGFASFNPSEPTDGGGDLDPVQAYNERKLYLTGQQIAIQNAKGNYYNSFGSGANSSNPIYSFGGTSFGFSKGLPLNNTSASNPTIIFTETRTAKLKVTDLQTGEISFWPIFGSRSTTIPNPAYYEAANALLNGLNNVAQQLGNPESPYSKKATTFSLLAGFIDPISEIAKQTIEEPIKYAVRNGRSILNSETQLAREAGAIRGISTIGKFAKGLGIAGNVASLGVGFYNVFNNPSIGNIARLTVAGIGASANLVPVVGTVLSIGIGLAEQAGAFEGIYRYLDRVHK